VAERPKSGVLDTRAYIDLALLDPATLPAVPEITAITMAELHQGVAMARDAATRAARTEVLGAAIVEFDPLPFDAEAAARYGTPVALTLQANRDTRWARDRLSNAYVPVSRIRSMLDRYPAPWRGVSTVSGMIRWTAGRVTRRLVRDSCGRPADHQPRSRHSWSFGRSAPRVESSP